MASHAVPDRSKYFVPEPSAYPFALTVGLVMVILGVWSYLEEKHLGPWLRAGRDGGDVVRAGRPGRPGA